MASPMTVQCPSCETTYPVDPDKVPAGGVRTQCTVCQTMFRVDRPWEKAVAPPEAGAPDSSVDAGPAPADEPPGEAHVEESPDAGAAVVEDFGAELDEVAPAEPFESSPDLEEGLSGVEEMEEALAEFEAAAEATRVEGDVEEASGEDEPPVADAGEVEDVDVEDRPSLEDWVVETHEPHAFDEIEVERLETVEEELRAAAEGEFGDAGEEEEALQEEDDEPFSGFMAAGEVMLTESDLDTPVGGPDEVEDAGADDFGGPDLEVVSFEAEVEITHDEPGLADLEPSPAEVEVGPEEAEGPGAGPAGLEDAPLDEETMDDVDVTFAPEAAAEAPAEEVVEEPPEEAEPVASPGAFGFGKRDPHEKARRLARVLVSDMITYNPERHARALERDTLAEDFEEEIDKSWAEYVEQVGTELAESTSYWTDALNEILARGESLF